MLTSNESKLRQLEKRKGGQEKSMVLDVFLKRRVMAFTARGI